MEAPLPRVSAIIPTAGRPALVIRAVRSALDQTMESLEVVAVLDGADPDARARLRSLEDPRVRVVEVPTRVGPGAARNVGVKAARASWIAFLDDDDEWLPGKLEAQLATARASSFRRPVVAARVRARGRGEGAPIWPRRLPEPGEPFSEYLFSRRTLFWGETLVHTSTLLVPRDLLFELPFREDLRKNEDLDWLLRALDRPGVGLEFIADPEPLAIWSVDGGRPRSSRRPDWRASLAWVRSVRPFVTRRAYAAFLLTSAAADAARERSLLAFWHLPREAFRHGRPRALHVLLFIGIWLVPAGLRERLGRTLTSRGGA
ncbi:MAG: glycosyltransferase family 2 protein [Gemmatimonadota bacterium]